MQWYSSVGIAVILLFVMQMPWSKGSFAISVGISVIPWLPACPLLRDRARLNRSAWQGSGISAQSHRPDEVRRTPVLRAPRPFPRRSIPHRFGPAGVSVHPRMPRSRRDRDPRSHSFAPTGPSHPKRSATRHCPALPHPWADQDREQLRPAQGLAARRNTLRQVPQGLLVGMRIGCRRHVLVMNPDPNHASRPIGAQKNTGDRRVS